MCDLSVSLVWIFDLFLWLPVSCWTSASCRLLIGPLTPSSFVEDDSPSSSCGIPALQFSFNLDSSEQKWFKTLFLHLPFYLNVCHGGVSGSEDGQAACQHSDRRTTSGCVMAPRLHGDIVHQQAGLQGIYYISVFYLDHNYIRLDVDVWHVLVGWADPLSVSCCSQSCLDVSTEKQLYNCTSAVFVNLWL